MNNLKRMMCLILMAFGPMAAADLEPFDDCDVSDAVWELSTIKVDANMGDAYLEGLKKTWVSGNEISKKLGHIEDYSIFRSQLPESGDFNLLLLVKFANTADLAPNKEKYQAFMKEFGEKTSKETTEHAQKNYPGMREITGQYLIREVTIK